MEIPKPFIDWQDTPPLLEMVHFTYIANLFKGIEHDFELYPARRYFDYNFYSEDEKGKPIKGIINGVDRTFLWGLWFTRRNLYNNLCQDYRQEFADETLKDIDTRYRRSRVPIKIPVKELA